MERERLEILIRDLEKLTEGQLFWVETVVEQLQRPLLSKLHVNNSFIDEKFVQNFGDILRIHHCFSSEPFSKDKFEYAMELCSTMSGLSAKLAPKGNPGHDITIEGQRISLKTQADKNIKKDKIHISKFMELGSGQWSDKLDDLIGLRSNFFRHLESYERIFILRRFLIKEGESLLPHYELVEIPKTLLLESANGELEMKFNAKQFPKPGYCTVFDESKKKKFDLYFDGGTERKLQIKNLNKDYCIVHAEWILM